MLSALISSATSRDPPFARAVGGLRGDRHLGPGNLIALGEPRAEVLAERGHGREVAGAAMIEPVPKLVRAKRRLAQRRDLGLQFHPRHADQVPLLLPAAP